MTTDGSRKVLEQSERKLDGQQCYWCGERPKPPDEMVALPGTPLHVSFVLYLRTPCCHQAVSTEHYGTVVDYLCDGWARAQHLRRLYNTDAGLPNLPDQPRPRVPWRDAEGNPKRRFDGS